MQYVDGKMLANELFEGMVEKLSVCAQVPRLGVLMIDPTPETQSFVRIKEKRAEKLGVPVETISLDKEVTQADALHALDSLIDTCDGVVLQQPVPTHLNLTELLNHIPKKKDIDVLAEHSFAPFAHGVEGAPVPPVAGAIVAVFATHAVEPAGKRAVVVGAGNLVGKPAAVLLANLGAEVTVMTKETGIDATDIREADIVVSGAGVPGIITPDMTKEGVVLIDAGTSEAEGKLKGDIDPACAERASLYTPVPGGIGPLTVASLFINLIEASSCR